MTLSVMRPLQSDKEFSKKIANGLPRQIQKSDSESMHASFKQTSFTPLCKYVPYMLQSFRVWINGLK